LHLAPVACSFQLGEHYALSSSESASANLQAAASVYGSSLGGFYSEVIRSACTFPHLQTHSLCKRNNYKQRNSQKKLWRKTDLMRQRQLHRAKLYTKLYLKFAPEKGKRILLRNLIFLQVR